MGIERKTIPARMDIANVEFIDSERMAAAIPPSRSSFINSAITMVRRLNLSPTRPQFVRCDTCTPFLPLTIGPFCIDPLHAVLEWTHGQLRDLEAISSPRRVAPERGAFGRAAGKPSPEVSRRRALRES